MMYISVMFYTCKIHFSFFFFVAFTAFGVRQFGKRIRVNLIDHFLDFKVNLMADLLVGVYQHDLPQNHSQGGI